MRLKPKRSILSLALALSLAAPALADDAKPVDPHSPAAIATDAHRAAAAKLQRIAMPREISLTLVNSIAAAVSARMSAGQDSAKVANNDALIREFMTSTIDEMNAIIASHFASRLSDAQISEYTAFFSQPIYARYMSDMPSIMTELTPWLLDREQSDIEPAFARARARALESTPIAPPAAVPDSPPTDAHTALALAVFQHAQSERGPLEEVLWRSQARELKGVDDATRQKIHDAFIAEIAPLMPAYRVQFAQIILRRFSDDELKQIDDFFSAPTYHNFMTELHEVMVESRPELMEWVKTSVLPKLIKAEQQSKSEGASP